MLHTVHQVHVDFTVATSKPWQVPRARLRFLENLMSEVDDPGADETEIIEQLAAYKEACFTGGAGGSCSFIIAIYFFPQLQLVSPVIF